MTTERHKRDGWLLYEREEVLEDLTTDTHDMISYHKFRIQSAIENCWDFLAKIRAKNEITEERYQHLKTFPERFIEFEKHKEQDR